MRQERENVRVIERLKMEVIERVIERCERYERIV